MTERKTYCGKWLIPTEKNENILDIRGFLSQILDPFNPLILQKNFLRNTLNGYPEVCKCPCGTLSIWHFDRDIFPEAFCPVVSS